jgi:hypothetical protein
MREPKFLPPSALQAEAIRTKRLKDETEEASKVSAAPSVIPIAIKMTAAAYEGKADVCRKQRRYMQVLSWRLSTRGFSWTPPECLPKAS